MTSFEKKSTTLVCMNDVYLSIRVPLEEYEYGLFQQDKRLPRSQNTKEHKLAKAQEGRDKKTGACEGGPVGDNLWRTSKQTERLVKTLVFTGDLDEVADRLGGEKLVACNHGIAGRPKITGEDLLFIAWEFGQNF